MKRISTKTSKRFTAVILAAFVAFSVVGCSTEKSVTTTSTQTVDENDKVKNETAEVEIDSAKANELITYEFETFDNLKVVIDENSIITQEPSDDPEYSDFVSEEARGNIIAPGRDFVYLEDENYYYVADIFRKLITVADKNKSVANVSNEDELPENPQYNY